MSLIYVGLEDSNSKKSNRNLYSASKQNYFAHSKSNRSNNLSPVYTKNYVTAANRKQVKVGLWETLISITKSIFNYIYLLVTNFSIRLLIDTLFLLFDYIFITPFRSLMKNKVVLVIISVIIGIMSMGYILDWDIAPGKEILPAKV